MSSTRRPAATRQQRGRLQPFGDSTGTGVDRGPGDGTGTGVGRGPGRRATLAKPAVTFAADLTSGPTVAPQSREGDTRSPPATPVRPGGDARRRPAEVKVTCHSPEQEDLTSSGSHHRMPPLLGYDWIAGVLDAEGSSLERSEDFFDDLRAFRSMNKDECVSSRPVGLLEEGPSAQQVLTGGDNPESSMGTHQCTFCYRVNSRLFPVPLDPQECCPVCRRHKSTIPHTAAQPALVRVSIPRSTLVPVYEYKAHRRRSFDPSDSLGLPSHCLSGWANTGQTTTPQADNLDLRSSLNVNKTADLLWQTDMDSSLSGGSGCRHGDQSAAVSRLARYNFQHLSPKRKYTRDTSFHVY